MREGLAPRGSAPWGLVKSVYGKFIEFRVSGLRYPNTILSLFSFWVSLLKLIIRKKGGLIIKGLLGNLACMWQLPATTILVHIFWEPVKALIRSAVLLMAPLFSFDLAGLV